MVWKWSKPTVTHYLTADHLQTIIIPTVYQRGHRLFNQADVQVYPAYPAVLKCIGNR